MLSISESLKKLKTSENKEVLHNYSTILSSCFSLEKNTLQSFLYSFKDLHEFGILLPIKYHECPSLDFIGIFHIELDLQNKLRKFQHELWSDLLKTSKETLGRVSEANYYIVPLSSKKVNWDTIKKALGEGEIIKIKNVPAEERKNLILKSNYKPQGLWKYLGEITQNNSVSQFFDFLFMSDSLKAKENQEKFLGFEPADVVFDERFSNPSTKELRTLLSSGAVDEVNENSSLVFVKQLKSIRTNDTEVLNKNTKGVPFLPIDLFDVFYLNFSQWEQARKVFQILIEVEEFSWALELAEKFSFTGNFCLLKASMSFYCERSRKIFENLEILGGIVCNFLIGIRIFLQELQNFQGKDFEKMIKELIGINGCDEVCRKFELFRYLKTQSIKPSSFRPAFYASKETVTECYNIEHVIPENLSAAFVRSLAGSILLSNGIRCCAEFLVRLEIIEESQFRMIEKYLTDDSLFIINSHCASRPNYVPKDSEIFQSLDKSSIETILDYSFCDTELWEKAKKIDLFNQKLVKFVGKTLIDLIISYNLLVAIDLETSLYLYIFSEIRSSFNISRITLLSGLYQFVQSDSEKDSQIQLILTKNKWDDLFKPNDLLPVYLANFFYNLCVSIFLDCQNISLFFNVVGYFFADLLTMFLNSKTRLKKNLKSSILEILKSSPVKIEYKEIVTSSGGCTRVYIGRDLICESTSKTSKQAKLEASIIVYKFICLCNLIQYNRPLLFND